MEIIANMKKGGDQKPVKKVWTAPVIELISNNSIEGGIIHNVHETVLSVKRFGTVVTNGNAS